MIQAKFQIGEELHFDNTFFKVVKRTVSYDLDLGEKYVTISYTLKNTLTGKHHFNVTENQIAEEIRMSKLKSL